MGRGDAASLQGSACSSVAERLFSGPRGREQARRAEGGGFSTKRRRRLWLRFSQVGFTREENLEIRSHAAPTSTPPPPHPITTHSRHRGQPSLKQPRNVRAPLKPLSVIKIEKKTRANVTCKKKNTTKKTKKKKVFVRRLVDEVQSVFWAKHGHPFDTRVYSDSDWATDQDHSLLSPLLLLNPLQHMTCVTATDLHWKIRAVEGQGKSPKRRREEGGRD